MHVKIESILNNIQLSNVQKVAILQEMALDAYLQAVAAEEGLNPAIVGLEEAEHVEPLLTDVAKALRRLNAIPNLPC